MSPASAASAIETAIASGWTATPIAWPNVPFTPPTDGSWLKVNFLWGNGQILTKGGLASIVGILQLAVFTPNDMGDGDVDASAETARALFNQLRLASPNQDVMFGSVSGPVKQNEESWRSVVLSCPFECQETV